MWSFGRKSVLEGSEDEELLTFLGKGAELKGSLHVDGPTRVDGIIDGAVHVKGTLIIGKHAVIKGDVTAQTLVSAGNITGDVIARESVKLLAPCALMGSVQTPLLSVEEGVIISGTCDMIPAPNGHEDLPIEELLQQDEQFPATASQ
jgi:cytoskeletal protein CcmA (bactofilin family)